MGKPSPGGGANEKDAYRARVGSTIKGKWTLESLLGLGGMAAVYAAEHRNGQRVALKILHADFARDAAVTERFLREAYVSNKVGHPACVRVVDDDVTDEGEPFLIMELLLGKTLREVWTDGGRRLPPLQVLGIVDPILDCLVACHAIGVIHRDLKPANIFLCSEGTTKVLDFGIAQFRSATSERTATGTALGTPSYMSPEQAMGLVDQLDGRTDVFSVGAILHALTAGQRINKGRTENEALVMAATTPVPSVARIAPDLPLPLIALIDKALAWDRRNRFADAAEMLEAVRALARELGGSSQPSTRPAVKAPRPEQAPAEEIPVEEASIGETGQVAPDDPRVLELRDAFRRIDRALPNVRQFGWEHAATARAMRGVFQAVADIAGKRGVEWNVRPYCFTWKGHVVWEPAAPFDSIPYNLFACGLRAIRLTRGLTMAELQDLLALFLLEPGRDLPPDDDLVTALWERELPHIERDIADAFVEGDAAAREAFYDEADAVEREAGEAAQTDRLEARAMAVSVDRDALASGVAAATPMGLDDVVRAVLASELALSRDAWNDRYVDVLLAALIDAARKRDAGIVLSSLRRSSADLVVAGGLANVTWLHLALLERAREILPPRPAQQLADALTNAFFGEDTLALVLGWLEADPARLPTVEPVLEALSPIELPAVLSALERPQSTAVRQKLLAYVERVLDGNETEVLEGAGRFDTETATAVVEVFARAATPAAREALSRLAETGDLTLRTEAKVHLAGSPEAAAAELTSAIEAGGDGARVSALHAVLRHQVRGAWPVVARLARAGDFDDRAADERAALLAALIAIVPDRGEPIALEIAKKRSLIASGRREAARLSAIEALGAYGRSRASAEALLELAQSRWGATEEARHAAQAAADGIAERLAAEDGGQP